MQPGDLIAEKYRLERVLGEGGMGKVFSAVNVVTGKQVAIKWLHAELGKGEEYTARFMREAQVASRIDHPNVVNVFDAGRHGESLFLVMEHLAGETLADLLQRGIQDHTAFVQLMFPVMRGVQAAHRLGIVHRDLKPDNIFLCRGPDGEMREPKVLDFGISKIAEELGGNGRQLTRDGAVFGTPQYMAPEQVRNSRTVDARADIYALGVIFYRALSGEFPYDADTLPALALRIVEGDAVPLDVACPGIDPGLAAAVMRALALDPADRFQTVAAFAAALEPHAGGLTFATPSAVWITDPDATGSGVLRSRTPPSSPKRERTPAEQATSDAPPTLKSSPRARASATPSGQQERVSTSSPTPTNTAGGRVKAPVVGAALLGVLALVAGAWALFGSRSDPDVQQSSTLPVQVPSAGSARPAAAAAHDNAPAVEAQRAAKDEPAQAAPSSEAEPAAVTSALAPRVNREAQAAEDAMRAQDASVAPPPDTESTRRSARRHGAERSQRRDETPVAQPAAPVKPEVSDAPAAPSTLGTPPPVRKDDPLLHSDRNPYLQR